VPAHGVGGGEGHAPAGAHGGHSFHDPSLMFNWLNNPAPFGGSSYKAQDQYGGPMGDNALGPDKVPLPPGATEEPMSVPFVLVLINFGIVLFILGWKVGPVARQMAEKRSDDIKGALDEAARLRKQAADKLAEYSTKLRAAESEIDQLIKDMRSDAEAERARIIASAEAQAAALKKDAEERIAAEIERAQYALQKEVVLAATTVAEGLLRTKTTAADQAALVDTFIRNVDAAAGARPR
jgi:F0F1-type ATP synthase membrane subunit b/b'